MRSEDRDTRDSRRKGTPSPLDLETKPGSHTYVETMMEVPMLSERVIVVDRVAHLRWFALIFDHRTVNV